MPASDDDTPDARDDGDARDAGGIGHDTYELVTDPARIDVDAAHAFLSTTYWSRGIPRETLARAIAHSLCVAVRHARDGQVAFARVVTDRATFGYLADVHVLEAHRGRGLARRLVAAVVDHPDLQGLRRMLLATRDAHGLYAQFGFTPLADASRLMERHRPEVYTGPEIR